MSRTASSVVLIKYPEDAPSPVVGEHFDIGKVEVPNEAPENGLLVELLHLSADPYLRNKFKPKAMLDTDLTAVFPLNQPISGHVTGKVVKSNNAKWKQGDLFGAHLPFVTVQQVTDLTSFTNLTPYVSNEQEASIGLGLLGMPGSTAYAALDLMNVTEQDRVWVNACTGAVGSLVGQLCKNVRKCQLVVGSCGSKEKCELAKKKFGYDECFDYHEVKPDEGLKKYAPEGVDFVFENVGGDHFEAALANLRNKGRVAVCGAISGYNSGAMQGNLPLTAVIYKQLRIEGFLCFEWLTGQRGNFLQDMSKWYKQGLITKDETVFDGIESWPKAFATLLQAGNTHVGKIVVKV